MFYHSANVGTFTSMEIFEPLTFAIMVTPVPTPTPLLADSTHSTCTAECSKHGCLRTTTASRRRLSLAGAALLLEAQLSISSRGAGLLTPLVPAAPQDTMRRLCVVCSGFVFQGNTCTLLNACGIALVIGGAGTYNVVKGMPQSGAGKGKKA